MYKSYTRLRPLAIFACIIGVLQSLTWLALAVVAIVAYYCQLNFRGMEASLGTVTELVMFHNYFHGTCPQSGLPNMDYGALTTINLLQPLKVHICMWIYLGISILWFISSITLITNVRYNYLRHANIFLYFWILLTTAISILDLGLGIAFGVDYDTLRQHSHTILLDHLTTGEHPQFIINPAKSAAVILMTVAFRGYVLWLINVGLCIYFFTQTLKISDYNRLKQAISNPASNPAFVSSTNSLHRTPIDVYGPKSDYWVDTVIDRNHDATDSDANNRTNQSAAALYAERKQHYDLQMANYRPFENAKPKRRRDDPVANVVREINYRHSTGNNHVYQPNVPVPDYSPALPRVNQFDSRPPLRSALRASRY